MEWASEFIDQLHEMGLSFLAWPVVRRRAEGRVTVPSTLFAG
jgi:hypothetical protein